ncbi:MAG: Holliday junction branch migration DNA helicase RuvB [Aquificae bacterium]|nr:Holliday junction branch migration DNA helicase RuvB [Aquificota bacterium]
MIYKRENILRPLSFDDFIGQEKVKEKLKLLVEASKKRNEPLDHILFSGPPGLGKTSMAQIVANELGKNIKITSGPTLDKKGDLAGILSSLEEGDILFIDEIHRLNPAVEETLYPAMEDFKIDILIGKGKSSRSIRLDIPRFTLIGATTKAGMLTSPLLSRFGLILNFDFYDEKSLSKIIKRNVNLFSLEITDEAALEIAKRSRGTPRIANMIVKRVVDYATVRGEKNITVDIALKALEFFEIDKNGLSPIDKKYLSILLKYGGKPVGLNTIASALSENKNTIEEIIEPYLLREGFIEKTPRGRLITEKAIEILKGA